MLPTSNDELSDEEFDELERFLQQDSGLDMPMSLSEIDGLLTAVLIGPEFPPPSVWIPLVWGGEQEPEFSSEEQAGRIMGLLLQHMNSLAAHLQDAVDEFEPMLLVDLDEDGQPITIADHWCIGFMTGVNLDADAWQDVEEVLLPMVMFAAEPGNAELDDELVNKRDYWIEQLPSTVAVLYRHFLAYRTGGGADSKTIVRPNPKVGRNELCPCGSGKKYKKCCGLH
ncbi:hypothetical protein MNBD_GAMMA25-1243 [hydrothermal vent metagenome]|uniref:YecA family protein n=1 Tax=hydrothermal vent metagenome TaxID=652676 RepID=A0A3B1B6A3_9ZZZZ